MAEIHDGESPELSDLFALMRRGQQFWVEGQPEQVDQHESMSIFGPFGGDLRIFSGTYDERQSAVRSQFRGGISDVQILRTVSEGNLVTVVSRSTSRVHFAGQAEPRRWELRVTEVYERTHEGWLRLHRHADPLTDLRPLTATLELLGERH